MVHRPPVVTKPEYDHTCLGCVGTFGAGGNAYIRFLQTAFTPAELEKTTLIENIRGSETWDVKDLFQRDVDQERVTKRIIPYLENQELVKFFNPLTLLLLPMQSAVEEAQKEISYSEGSFVSENGFEYDKFERKGHYRFSECKTEAAYSKLEWLESSTKLVAIDGQHRLQSLKRIVQRDAAFLRDWRIPVIIIGVFQEVEEKPVPDLLEVVRKIFLYINTEAKEVNESRRILLNDESVNAICVQTLVQEAHSNDCRPAADRDRSRMPLLYYDWRGATKDGAPASAPGAVKALPEVKAWFDHYILGEDGSPEQEKGLDLADESTPISIYRDGNQALSSDEAKIVREKFKEDCYQGVTYLLENFRPYEIYIHKIRETEAELLEGSDVAEYAYSQLRFGTNRASDEMKDDVNNFFKDVLVNQRIPEATDHIHGTTQLEIGMRAVMYAFGSVKNDFDEVNGRTMGWREYAEWFVDSLNKIYSDGWFQGHDALLIGSSEEKKKARLLKYISYNDNLAVENYRLQDLKKGLGAWVSILIVQYGEQISPDLLLKTLELHCDRLEPSLMKGFKKQAKAELVEENYEGTTAAIGSEVKERARKYLDKRMKEIRTHFGVAGE